MHKLKNNRCRTAVALALSLFLAIGSVPATPVQAASTTNKTATEVVKDMTVGWNIGNTMDSLGDANGIPFSSSRETYWGNPAITKELVEAVGAAGFNTIRIPVSWGQYTTGSNYQIPEFWMSRVKEVVDYCIDNDMYVILNSHHDITSTGKNYYRPDKAHKAESEKYFSSIWTQIAKEFKDYDYHLVFETMNEPRLINHSEEWWFPRNNPSSDIKEAVNCINDFNQVALDAIRATGGNNATRCVMVPGYDASIEGCMTDLFKLPKDSATNRLILSVHAYIPYYFALSSSPYETKFDNSTKGDIDSFFNDLNQKFLSKGTPVVVGETSATNRNNTSERVKWANYYWGSAEKYSNVAMVLWDNNIYDNPSGSDGECHRYIDRNSLQWKDPEIIDAIMNHVDGTPAKNNNQNGNQKPNSGEITSDATLLNTYGAEYGYFGTCINLYQLRDQSTLNLIKKNYNSVTLENEMKPDAILGGSAKLISIDQAKELGYYIPSNYKDSMVPRLNFNTIDEVMKICCENEIGLRAHTLVWHSQSPSWFFKNNFSGGGSFVNEETMNARMEMYIKTVMSHVYSNQYGKCVYAWDVVNEYPHANSENWLGVYGKCGNTPAFVKRAFEYAHEVLVSYQLDGKVSLFFNDYNTYMEVNDVLAIMKYINSDKKICDGIGMQSHCATWFPSVDYYTTALKAFLNAGYEVQITEMDVKSNNSNAEQADYVYNLFRNINQLKKNGAKITGITWWGLSDQVTWIDGQKPLLFATPTETKPAYDSILKAYAEVLGNPKNPSKPDFPTPVEPDDPQPTDPVDPIDPNPVDPSPVDPVDPIDPDPIDPSPVDPVVDGLSCEYKLNDWGSGFQILIKIKNEGSKVDTWTLKVNKDDVTINSSWNVNIEEENNYYVITPMAWNSVIEPGKCVEFGIQGPGGKVKESIECIVE